MAGKARRPEHQGELNIVPYLDIMVNLVMFMLMSMSGFISFQAVNATTTHEQRPPMEPPAKEAEKPLQLKVGVAVDGFYLACHGKVVAPIALGVAVAPDSRVLPTIPLTPAGEYDYAALTSRLTLIKAEFSDESKLSLAADAGVTYDVIIRTLDATHGDPMHPLFPDVGFDLDSRPRP